MENKEEGCAWCEGCNRVSDKMHGMACGRHHHIVLRWILGLLILAFVFGAGIKLGELKERMFGGSYGYRASNSGYNMMQRGYNVPDAYTYPGGMMQGWIDIQRQNTNR